MHPRDPPRTGCGRHGVGVSSAGTGREVRLDSKRITPWRLACLAGLASLWGMSELLGGPTLRVTATALLLLAIGRAILNLPGSSLAIAGVAVIFRAVNAAPFYCHLAGVALLGAAFDAMATLLLRGEGRMLLRDALAGAASALLSAASFAFAMVYVFRFRSWPQGGFGRVAEHTFYSGGRAALLALLVVPLGLLIGRELSRVAVRHSRPLLAAAAGAGALLWLLGPFIG